MHLTRALFVCALLVLISCLASCLQAEAQQQVAAADNKQIVVTAAAAAEVDSSPLGKLIKGDKPLRGSKKQPPAKKAKTDSKTNGDKYNKSTMEDQTASNDQVKSLLKRPQDTSVESSLAKPMASQQQQQQEPASLQHGQRLKFGLTSYDDDLPADSPISKLRASAEHKKSIVEDKHGIRKLSIFSSNNHMGDKQPPKFGSEEEY